MDHLKKAMSMKTGRVAMLPPQIYNNPVRMASGQWVLIEQPKIDIKRVDENTFVIVEPNNTTAPAESFLDTFTSEEPTAEAPKKKGRKPKQSTNDRPEAAE